jgi:hypothetical protein
MAVLLISRYSDTATIIKQKAGVYIQFNGDSYSKSMPLSNSNMADLFDTCGSILVKKMSSKVRKLEISSLLTPGHILPITGLMSITIPNRKIE